ncbi:hypothetical protein [Pseudoalteromonas luteoviolacea]|uniref:Uncharacterized protein n=1 Tax=Pseudoalteromonas luteoviolacea DSM 6061 TaxID=1365250 RepID=A0A166UVA3_9GAMM|nr:hypothetical protein [Pseudoalteromonas luteoviolacea]KZN30848.1 hypothetical protein N475_23905 [Pseudoalteromonas luteoviolacea DSM 6061]MBE0388657.1 hypothetical protein [Pseudoalteromonas luteoviolacea DSM 6061]
MLGTICINLDSFEILNFELGSSTNLLDGNHQNGSVSFYIEDSIIKSLVVRLNEFYSKGETYEGSLVFNGETIVVSKQFQPVHILGRFTHQTDHWDDGVEVNYQFQVQKATIEFSWHWQAGTLVPNYISIEID